MKKLTLPILFLIFGFFVFPQPALATILTAKDQDLIIAQDETIDDDLFIAADNVTIDGTVNGDLYAAGGVVSVSGTINGDILAAGGMLNISGTIKDDLRIAGGQINIQNAQIGDNANLFGGNITIDDQTTIGGSLVFGAGNFSTQAQVGRGLLGGAGNLVINGPIGKSARLGAGTLTLGPLAQINGDLLYTSDEQPTINPTATVSGELKKITPPSQEKAQKAAQDFSRQLPRVLFGVQIGLKIWSFLSALLVGVLLLYFFLKPTQHIATQIQKQLLPSLVWGFLIAFFFLPILIVLMITGIGIPLALILALLFAIELYLAKIFAGVCFGNWLANQLNLKNSSPYIIFTLGLLGIYLITSIPIIGFLARIVVTLLGLGAIFLSKKQLIASLKK